MAGTPGARHVSGAPMLCKGAADVATLSLSSVCFIFTTLRLIAESWSRAVGDVPLPASVPTLPLRGSLKRIPETRWCVTHFVSWALYSPEGDYTTISSPGEGTKARAGPHADMRSLCK